MVRKWIILKEMPFKREAQYRKWIIVTDYMMGKNHPQMFSVQELYRFIVQHIDFIIPIDPTS